MKALYRTSYSFYREKQKKPLNFVLLSDLHFSTKLKNYVLEKVADYVESQKPDYILFLGDLVHSIDDLDNNAQKLRLKSFFERLSAVAPVISIYGNHDFYRHDEYKRGRWKVVSSDPISNLLSNSNVRFLKNEIYEDDNLFIYGFNPDSEYYCYDSAHGNRSSVFNPQTEDKNILMHNLKQIPEDVLRKRGKGKIRIFLSHSPIYLGDKDVKPFLTDFDIYISGHMHNGVVSPALNDIWLSTRGIMAPGHKLFQPRTRNAMMSYKDPNIILGAIQTIQPGLNPMGILSHAFPIFVANLTISEDITCRHRPRKKREYL